MPSLTAQCCRPASARRFGAYSAKLLPRSSAVLKTTLELVELAFAIDLEARAQRSSSCSRVTTMAMMHRWRWRRLSGKLVLLDPLLGASIRHVPI